MLRACKKKIKDAKRTKIHKIKARSKSVVKGREMNVTYAKQGEDDAHVALGGPNHGLSPPPPWPLHAKQGHALVT